MSVVLKPTQDERSFWRGEIVFDRQRTDILSDPLCVVSRETTRLGDIRDRETFEAVKYNDTNVELAGTDFSGLPNDTPCVEVAFLDGEDNEPTVEGRTYTYPTFRLMRVVGDEDSKLPNFRPPMMAAAELIQQLEGYVETGSIESAEELHVALMECGVDGEMLAAASKIARDA